MKFRTMFAVVLAVFMMHGFAIAKLPFDVKVYYIQGTDAPEFSQLRINKIMLGAQDLYRSEMVRHGFAPKTFRLQMKGDDVRVHVFKGRNKKAHYALDTMKKVQSEKGHLFKNQNYAYILFVGGLTDLGGGT